MSYVVPPTFVDDQILSAAQLNVLGDDIAYLYGLARAANPPFPQVYTASAINGKWLLRHRCRYLYAQIRWVHEPGGNAFPLTITYGGVTVKADSLGGNGTFTNSYQIDLNPHGFTMGQFYEITVQANTNSYFGTYLWLKYLYEAD